MEITAKSRKLLNLVYELHHSSAERIDQPKRRFNWSKLRFEWWQVIVEFTAEDNVEVVDNFGGDYTERTTWTYTNIQGNRTIKIFYAKQGEQSTGFKEWVNKVIHENQK